MAIKSDLEQLNVGLAEISDIKKSYNNYTSSIDDVVKSVKNVSKEYKVNLDDTIKIDGITEAFEYIEFSLEDSKLLAIKQHDLVKAYNSGDYSMLTMFDGCSPDDAIKALLLGNQALLKPSVATKVIATAGMGIFKGVEGFFDFFEDMGDCVVIAGSSFMSLIGNDKVAKEWAEHAATNHISNAIEGSEVFNKANRYSYFDKDSTYANMWKLAGAGVGAVVFGSFASSIYFAHRAKTVGTAVSSVSKNAGKVSGLTTNVGSSASTFGSNVSTNLQQGYSFDKAVMYSAVVTGTTFGLSSGVSAPIGNKIADKINTSVIGKGIEMVDSKATDLFSKEIVETSKAITRNATDLSSRQIKSSTGDLASDDGNQRSVEDMTLEVSAKQGVDFTKTIVTGVMK